jgi:hypothetical protein
MMCLTKMLSAALAIALLAGTAAAADTIVGGKIKSISADKKTFVLTDSAKKDFTVKFDDHVVVNRDGKESKSDVKVGDAINVCCDKGVSTWTAHYILVQEGASKNSELIRGSVKTYNAAKKELTFTNEVGKDLTFPMGTAAVRVNMEDSKIDNVRIGDHALLIVDTIGNNSTLQSVMIDRTK